MIDYECMYDITLWHICLTIVAMELQQCVPFLLLSYICCQQYKNVFCCHGNATSDFLCTVVHLKMFVLLLTIISIRYYECVYVFMP